jgi:tetratricopeptide (TPR) repeat protein
VQRLTREFLCTSLVELELSLFDDAAERFARVLQRDEGSSHAIAAYGQGIALLSIAQRDHQDGKAGSALVRIEQAIDSCQHFSVDFGCTRKLLGDLYSFGASLPPNVFISGDDPTKDDGGDSVQRQVEFVAKGENAYRSVLDAEKFEKADEASLLRASVVCDVASNILLQAQIAISRHESGNISLQSHSVPEVDKLYERASEEFRNALEANPLHVPAWCGLGCAVLTKDPLLAQHAFCRCLQIEKMFPDAYANVGFLYTSQQAFGASESVMSALTQVADTPMMWINRAFMLERGAAAHLGQDPAKAERNISQAADAYRAALQVMKLPDAQLGLSMTGRIITAADDATKYEKSRSISHVAKRKDSSALLKEFLGASHRLKDAASVFGGIMALEQVADADGVTWSDELFSQGQELTKKALLAEGLDGFLDVEAVKTALEKHEDEGIQEEKKLDFPMEVSLQRQILHEPDRPDLWLSLAKSLISSSNASNAVESAIAAANRAARMLTEELVYPRRVNGEVASSVKAETVSEALSLVHWLQGSQDKKGEVGETKVETSQTSAYDLQRSIMMCPNNPLAREALKLG